MWNTLSYYTGYGYVEEESKGSQEFMYAIYDPLQ